MRVGSFASRFVALALLALAILAGMLLIVAPLLTAHGELASTIERSRGLLYRYRALSARQAQLSVRLEAVQRRATDAGAYIRETSDTLAGLELQKHVQSIVERSGGEVHSIQVLPVEPVELEVTVSRVALKLKLAVEMGRLHGLIYEIETAQPFVFIGELTLLSVGESRRRGNAGSKPMLDVQLEVYGFTHAPSIVTPVEVGENAELVMDGTGQGSGP